MNILHRTYASISHVNLPSMSQNWWSNLSSAQQKAIMITAVVLAAITAIAITVRCCLTRRNIRPMLGPQANVVKNPTPVVHAHRRPHNQIHPQPTPVSQPVDRIPRQHGQTDPLVHDAARQDLLDMEQKIDKLREDINFAQQMLSLGVGDDSVKHVDAKDAKPQVQQPAPQDPPSDVTKDPTPQVSDQKDVKDSKPQDSQQEPKDPPKNALPDPAPPVTDPTQLSQKELFLKAIQLDSNYPNVYTDLGTLLGKGAQPQNNQPVPQDPPTDVVKDPTPQVSDQKDDKDSKPQDSQPAPNDPPSDVIKDPVPPPVPDQKDVKDPNLQNIQPGPKDPQDKKSVNDPKATQPKVADKDDGLSANKKKIFELHEELAKTLLAYPEVLRKYLVNRFDEDGRNDRHDSHEIFEHVSKLSGYMVSFPEQTQFISNGLQEMDRFLTDSLFTSKTESCLQEESKIDLIVFQEFFTIVNEHISQCDSALALRLKIKLANLPLVDANIDRKSFTNIYLDEAAQKNILIDHFQQREDEAIDHAIAQLKTKAMTDREATSVARNVVVGKTRLSPKNMQKLKDALIAQMGTKAPTKWDDHQQVYNALKKYFTLKQNLHYDDDPWIDMHQQNPGAKGLSYLDLASRAKKYFTNCTEIPRWYHATNYQNIQSIIKSREIEVRHRQAFKGAWVSTQREASMGDCVFVFRHAITELDPDVFIGYEKKKIRWRGLQKAIPMVVTKTGQRKDVVPNVVLVGLGNHYQKTDKVAVAKLLKGIGIATPKVVYNDLVDYIQSEMIAKIGNPNLTEKWWGKADVKHLDNPLEQFVNG